MTELDVAPIFCHIPQAAARLALCERSIYQLIATGKIEAVKWGKRILVVVASLDRYAASLPKAKIKPITRRRRAAESLDNPVD